MTVGWLPSQAAEATIARLFPEADPFATDPVGWIGERLGEHLWSKQVEIAESVVANRYTAVRSAHATGKTHIASRLIAHWLSVHPIGEAFAVVTAPTAVQISAVLFRELRVAHHKGQLGGYITQGSDPMWKTDSGEIIAIGRKPQDADPTAFQGIHARFVLVVIDEACGVPAALYEAVDSLATSESARVLAIGNPTDPAAHFAEICKPGSGWNSIHVDGLESPNFTGEEVPDSLAELLISPTWAEERERRWGATSPQFQARVRGEFPDLSDDTLIAPAWIEAAQHRSLAGLSAGCYGVDVSRMGGDETVIYRNRGGHVRLVWAGSKQDTMATAGRVARTLREDGHGGVPAVIDAVGVGAGVLDRLREQRLDVTGFESSGRPRNPMRFANRRAECWWRVRELFEQGLVDLDPADEVLAAQLGGVKWKLNSSGQVLIESKDEMRRRGMASPDRADAVVMSFWGGWDRMPLTEIERILLRQAVERARESDRVFDSAFGAPVDIARVQW